MASLESSSSNTLERNANNNSGNNYEMMQELLTFVNGLLLDNLPEDKKEIPEPNVSSLKDLYPFEIQEENELTDEDQKRMWSEKCLKLNIGYQKKLRETKAFIDSYLKECDNLQSTPEEIPVDLKKLQFNVVSLSKFGKPYFKDSDGFPCQINADTSNKMKKGVIDVALISRAIKWQKWELKLLDETVSKVALSQLQAPFLVRKKRIQEQLSAEEASGAVTKKTRRELEKIIAEIARQAGEPLFELLSNSGSNIDWMRIAASEFDGRRSANDCQAMWNAFLAPGVSRLPWDDDETKKLQKVVTRHGNQDWESIAEEHGNGRTAYQCFVHWQATMNKLRNYWSDAEDKRLVKAISKCQQGSYIPFKKVARMLPGRTSQQCRQRWILALNNEISNTPFSGREDTILLTARQAYCMAFKQIALLLPGRTHNQLRVRYTHLDQLSPSMAWTREEDELLTKLVDEQITAGKMSFASLVPQFPERTRQQLRSRYSYLRKNKKVKAKKKQKEVAHEKQKMRKRKRVKSTNKSELESDMEPATKSRPARAAASKPSTQTASSDSVTRTSIPHDPKSNAPPVNIPVPTPSNLATLVKLVNQSNKNGRKYRHRDYIDQAICQVFRSHYHQPKGRTKKYYTSKDMKIVKKLCCLLLEYFQTSLDWTKDEELAKYPGNSDSLLQLYRRLHQLLAEGQTCQPLPSNEVKISHTLPPSVTTLIGLRTLLLEQRGLLTSSLNVPTPEMQTRVLQAGGIFGSLPWEKSQAPSVENDISSQRTANQSPDQLLDATMQSNKSAESSSESATHCPVEPPCKMKEPEGPVNLKSSSEPATKSVNGEELQHLTPETALSLFTQRTLGLFYWPCIMSHFAPSVQTYDGLFEGNRLSYVSDDELEFPEEDPVAESAPVQTEDHEDMLGSSMAETETETEDEERPRARLTKMERKRMLKARWERYRDEKRKAMEQAGITARDELLREEQEEEAERRRRKEAEVVRIPGKRGRPARRRRVRRRRLAEDRFEQIDDASQSEDLGPSDQ